MYKEKLKHFSLTTDWLESKSKFSKWGIFISNNGKKHLILRLKNIFAIHWFSYILKEDLKNEIDETINSKDSFLIHFSILKVLNLQYVNNKSRKISSFKSSKNFKTFIIPTKSSTKSKAENFLIDLKTWDINSLSKNWRRNLRRSERSLKKFTYKKVNLLKDLDIVYEIIIENSLLKNYRYPYSKDFLNDIVKKSSKEIICLGCYDNKGKLVAVRAFYVVDNIAIDFIAAALQESLKDYITYNIAFNLIIKAKELSLEKYNLGGVDFTLNKGVYNFKKGIGGKLISDGQMHVAISTKSYLPNFLIKILLRIISNLI